MEPQQAGPANRNPDADGPPSLNIKRSPLRVQLARPEWDIVMPEIGLSLNKVNPETEGQPLEKN
uniref:Uncharacterized protein n=1 Tax=Romanomermis culicivorax TaxID=13658 RepID=A0A915L376_ROMCU